MMQIVSHRKYGIAKNRIAAMIIENQATVTTMEDLEALSEHDLYKWVESWGYEWDGEWRYLGDEEGKPEFHTPLLFEIPPTPTTRKNYA